MKCFLLLFVTIVQSSVFFLFAQKPLSIKVAREVIDSVQLEVDRLYSLSEAKNKSLELIQKQEAFNQMSFDYLTYFKNDTVHFILLDSKNNVRSTYYYNRIENKRIGVDSNSRSMTDQEEILLNAKQDAIAEANKQKYEMRVSNEIEIDYIFHQNRNGFTLYAISVPKIDSIIPFGGDYLFLFNFNMKLQLFEKNGKFNLMSIRKKDNPPNSKLHAVSSPTGIRTNDFKVLIPYYYKFRRYHHNLRIEELESSINKRLLKYNAPKNDIEIKLFPVEKIDEE